MLNAANRNIPADLISRHTGRLKVVQITHTSQEFAVGSTCYILTHTQTWSQCALCCLHHFVRLLVSVSDAKVENRDGINIFIIQLQQLKRGGFTWSLNHRKFKEFPSPLAVSRFLNLGSVNIWAWWFFAAEAAYIVGHWAAPLASTHLRPGALLSHVNQKCR